mmetsp:Transcript_24637/g.67017  ORF Transcript_24637/g.67017 Transcript_24637/m.67017 type:complete len:205 (+) Transcript_24637:383-997(+)
MGPRPSTGSRALCCRGLRIQRTPAQRASPTARLPCAPCSPSFSWERRLGLPPRLPLSPTPCPSAPHLRSLRCHSQPLPRAERTVTSHSSKRRSTSCVPLLASTSRPRALRARLARARTGCAARSPSRRPGVTALGEAFACYGSWVAWRKAIPWAVCLRESPLSAPAPQVPGPRRRPTAALRGARPWPCSCSRVWQSMRGRRRRG